MVWRFKILDEDRRHPADVVLDRARIAEQAANLRAIPRAGHRSTVQPQLSGEHEIAIRTLGSAPSNRSSGQRRPETPPGRSRSSSEQRRTPAAGRAVRPVRRTGSSSGDRGRVNDGVAQFAGEALDCLETCRRAARAVSFARRAVAWGEGTMCGFFGPGDPGASGAGLAARGDVRQAAWGTAARAIWSTNWPVICLVATFTRLYALIVAIATTSAASCGSL